MERLQATLLTIVILVLIIVIGSYVWYNYTGWKHFGYFGGDTVEFHTMTGQLTENIRFRNVKFTVTLEGDSRRTFDVTGNLNQMAKNHTGSGYGGSNYPIKLLKPLNAFSFIIPGFNEKKDITLVTKNNEQVIPDKWKNAGVTLVGQWRIL